jgi:hypothetical protein
MGVFEEAKGKLRQAVGELRVEPGILRGPAARQIDMPRRGDREGSEDLEVAEDPAAPA